MRVSLLGFIFFLCFTAFQIASAEQVGNLNPGEIIILKQIAQDLDRTGKHVQALVIYKVLHNVEVDNPDATYKSAILSARLGDFNKAIELFNRAVAENPENSDKYYKCLLNLNSCK